jgi:hypothetical protein
MSPLINDFAKNFPYFISLLLLLLLNSVLPKNANTSAMYVETNTLLTNPKRISFVFINLTSLVLDITIPLP